MVNKLLIGFGGIILVLAITASAGIYWVSGFSPSDQELTRLRETVPSDIAYLQHTRSPSRGKILAVVTSTRTLGNTGRITGYELTELARAYWVFTANGFEVDVASPEGGEPYALLDGDDMGPYDYAFLNDPISQTKVKNTIQVNEVNADNYQAVYFVGGKGAMFDFPDNPAISHLVESFAVQGKLITAVCHGPAALVNAKDADGEWLAANKTISAFTDSEELLLIPQAKTIFPFLLQQKLMSRGANFIAGPDYLEQVSVSQGIITGQNPWSVWRVAEEAVRQLNYEPLTRIATPEENSVVLLMLYHKQGLDAAEKLANNDKNKYDGRLVLMHSLVAFMKWQLLDGVQLIILADHLKPSN